MPQGVGSQRMLADDVDRPAALHQRAQGVADLRLSSSKRSGIASVGRLSREDHRHIAQRDSPVDPRLPRTAEGRDFTHHRQLFQVHRRVPLLPEVHLHRSSVRHYQREFALDLARAFRPAPISIQHEAPRHQVPRPPLPRQIPRTHPRRIHAVLPAQVTREQCHRYRDRLGHVVAERPVAADFKAGMASPHFRDVPPEKSPIGVPVKLHEIIPPRIRHPPGRGRVPPPRHPQELRHGLRSIIRLDRPAVPIHPHAVDPVIPGQLPELRQHLLLQIRAPE